MQSVQKRISELEESFTRLCEDTRSDLKSKSVTMWHLKNSFRYLTRGDERLQDILVQIKNVDDFLTFIKHNWSWLNHELLWKTVRPLCSDKLKEEMKQYAEKLTTFCCEVTVEETMEYFNGLPMLDPPAEFSVLRVKLNYDPFLCTLVSIFDIQKSAFTKLTLGSEFTPFKKCELEDNSLYAVWFMPSHLILQLHYAIRQPEGRVLQEKHILSIVVDEVLLYPAPSEGVTMSTTDTQHAKKSTPKHSFYALLIKVSQQLSKQDEEILSFIFSLPSTETPRTPLDVLQKLEEMGVFSCDKIDPLIQLLVDINRDDIIPSCGLREYNETPAAKRRKGPTKDKSTEFRTLLFKVSQHLTSEDIEGLSFINNLSLPDSRSCTPLNFLQLLVNKGVYSHDRISLLTQHLEVINRDDIICNCGLLEYKDVGLTQVMNPCPLNVLFSDSLQSTSLCTSVPIETLQIKDSDSVMFRTLLIKVSRQLSKQDREEMSLKYSLPSTETPRTSLSLLRELEERGVFSHDNIDPLIQLLMDINRDDIVQKCKLRENKLNFERSGNFSKQVQEQHTQVDLSNRYLTDDDLQTMFEVLSPHLQILDLSGNQISNKGAMDLGRHLKNCPNLQTLNLSGNQIGNRGAMNLSWNLPNLQTLNLSGNQIGNRGAMNLSWNLPNLQSLNLSGNQIGDRGAMDLGWNLKNCHNLQTLNLSGNQIGDEGAMDLGMYLHNLQSLNLSGNQIGDSGAKDLGMYLPNLQSLNLSDNQIGDRGAKDLGMYLHNLQSLNLSDNQIGDRGAMDLGMYLHNLQSLNLSDNQIGDSGAKDLGMYLHNLQSLNLSGNQIGDSGAKDLGMYLHNLQSLNLSDNQIGDSGAKDLGMYLPNLQSLNLSGNNISDEASLKTNFPTHMKLILNDKRFTCDEYKENVSNDLEQDIPGQRKSVTVLDKSKVFKVYLHGYHNLSRVVSHYYQCAENSTHIPFIDPVAVIVCDHQGIEHTLVDHDITLTIPPGAIPIGKVVHFEMGVALYGPFNFPGNTRPISPILWLCPQEDIEFNSPIMVTLPHFLTHGLSQQELTQLGVGFAKANHNNFSGSKESQNVLFNFQPCSVQPQFSYKKQQGFGRLSTKHCCFLCLTANQCPQLARETGFCLTRIDCKSISSTYVVNFYVSFFLPSCLKVLDMLFPDYIDKNHFHFKFSNTDADQEDGYEQCLHLTLQDLPPNTYTTNTMPSEGKIKMSSVDFWHKGYNEKVMRLKHSTGMYPPRVRINFIPVGNHHQSCKVQVTVTGYTSDDYLNSEISLPLVSCSPSSPSMLNGHGASSFNMPLKFNGTVLTEREHLDINSYIKVLDERDIILLGQALGLLRSNLKKMKTLPDQMIDAWLNQADHVLEISGPPTWESLCEALKRIDQPGIAATIDQMKDKKTQVASATHHGGRLIDTDI